MNNRRFYSYMKKQSDAKKRLGNLTRKPSKFYKPEENTNAVRFLPWLRDPETLPDYYKGMFTLRDPETDEPIIEDGQVLIYVPGIVPVRIHYNLGTNYPFSCAEVFTGSQNDCVVCKKGFELWRAYKKTIEGLSASAAERYNNDAEFTKKFFADDRYFAFVLLFKNPDDPTPEGKTLEEIAEVKPWIFGPKIWEGVGEIMDEVDLKTHEPVYGDVVDAEEGRVVLFNRKGKGRQDTSYGKFQGWPDVLPVEIELISSDKESLLPEIKGNTVWLPDHYAFMQREMSYDEGIGNEAIARLLGERVTEDEEEEGSNETPVQEEEEPAAVTPSTAKLSHKDKMDMIRKQMKEKQAKSDSE